MIVEDQSETVAFLSAPETYGDAGPVRRVETHISTIFLVGERAYKLKRAVRFDYLDFSTAELRRRACEAEIRVNRRTAPEIYLGVRPVTREADGRLALGGAGAPVDWLVVMRRFDEDGLLDRLAARGALTPAIVEAATDAALALHRDAEPCPDKGGRAGMAWVVEGNLADLARHRGAPFEPAAVDAYAEAARAALDRLGARLDRRRRERFVRRCHGDLHLGNICLIDGRPVLFDAIEFNDDIACCDVLYDFAFLVMDLLHRGLRPLANLALNRYLALSGDLGGLPLLGLFLSCRAAVRAKIAATVAETAQGDDARRAAEEARRYLEDARAELEPGAPRLIAVGGLSGSGKSTLARALAPLLGTGAGALVLRSDVIRKRLFGRAPTERLGAEGYTPEVTKEVYARIARWAGEALAAGHVVIADAVFARPEERAAIARVAAEAGAPFHGFWLEAPAEALAARVEARVADASDADASVVAAQLRYDLGAVEWERIDAAGPPDAVRRRVVDRLAAAGARLEPVPFGAAAAKRTGLRPG